MNAAEEPSLKVSLEEAVILDDKDAADGDASVVDTSNDDAPGKVTEGVAAASEKDATYEDASNEDTLDGGTSCDDVPSKVAEAEAAFQKSSITTIRKG